MTADIIETVEGGVSLLDWLQVISEQHVPDTFRSAAVPVAWIGRTSTDDAQDPTLSLPRQLESCRAALPENFVIVAKFYDIESGRTASEFRGKGTAHEQFNIPIPRDGGIADMLAEAHRSDRRFVAVVCENIERIGRITYLSTKLEYELEQAGVALLAADEGIDPRAIPSLNDGSTPYRSATQVLTRRVKQAIAEWYVRQMLELSWGGFKEHTNQGFNIGKPPYGYVAHRIKHPVKAKANDGKYKHSLVPDTVRGPVVTQIFMWRALDRMSIPEIADWLNLDLDRYPPPDPIPGEGRRRVGAWTPSNVREVLDNPKHTGYMVWNRRKRSRKEKNIKGRVNPPSAWVWSKAPTHEPLVTRALFEAASTVGRFRKGSRSRPGENAHPETQRTYVLRSYLRCDLCNHRTYGSTRKRKGRPDDIYYRCTPNRRHCGHLPWFATHPPHVLVREDQLLDPLARFFKERVFGTGRKALTAEPGAAPSVNAELAARKAQLLAELVELRQRQDNLLGELENLVPTGDADVDAAWRAGIQRRFAAAVGDQRAKVRLLDEITGEELAAAPVDVNLLDQLPTSQVDLARLDEDHQRRLYDAFHLEMRYHALDRSVTIRVTITAETLPALAATAEAIIDDLPNAKGRGPKHELRPPANAVEMHGVPPAGFEPARRG